MKIAGLIVDYLKDNKEEIVDEINKKINISLISEAREEQIYDALFDGLMEILEDTLAKK